MQISSAQDNKQDFTQSRKDRFQILLKLSNMPKKDFASLIGKSSRMIYNWTTGIVEISDKNAINIANALPKIGVNCSVEWIKNGKGPLPYKNNSSSKEFPDIFEHFNLDFSFSSILNLYKKIYPESIYLLIEDLRFAPRLEPKCLLIAVPVPQASFKPNWKWGYLHPLGNDQFIPIDVEEVNSKLLATPFTQKPYISESFAIEEDTLLYPIINIRPIY